MGLTTRNIHCRVEGRPPEEALEALGAALRRLFAARGLAEAAGPEDAARALFLVPGKGRWIAVFDSDFEESETVAAFLSRDVGLSTVTLEILDSDRLGLKLFRNGEPAARLSAPAGRAKAPAIARAWLELAPEGLSSEDLAAVLSRDAVFAEDKAKEFAARLGIDRDLCVRPAADFREEFPPSARRLLYRAPAAATSAEPPRFRLLAEPSPLRLSAGEALVSLNIGALNTGGPANGLRFRVAWDPAEPGLLEIEEFVVVRFADSVRPDTPPERVVLKPQLAGAGEFAAVLSGVRVPGTPRTGSGPAVTAGWRAATVSVGFTGRAAAPGAGTLSVTIEPLDDPGGAAAARLPFEISGAPRMPLRAVAGSEKLARDLAEPAVLVALACLGADREAAAPAVRAAIEDWLDLVPGEWRVSVQRDPLDFDFKTLRINSAGRTRSRKWKDILEAAASCHLLWGAIDPDPRTGIGRAAFVLDASRPAFAPTEGVSPQLCFWTEMATAPAGAAAGLRGLLKDLVRSVRPLQAFLARWNWKPLSLGATPYETACGIGGAGALTAEWCGRYLRGVGEELWLGAPLTRHLDRAALEAVCEVSEGEGGWWVTPRGPVPSDAFENALAPVLAGREEWQGAVRR